MKKLFLLGLIFSLILSCDNKPQQYFSESQEIEAIKTRIKAYENQDWTTYKSQFLDSAQVFHNQNTGIPYLESLKRQQDIIANFASYGFVEDKTILEMVIDKDNNKWVNYWSVWSGKLKANGKEITFPVHLTTQFLDGKILKEYGYYDTAKLTAAFIELEAQQLEQNTSLAVE